MLIKNLLRKIDKNSLKPESFLLILSIFLIVFSCKNRIILRNFNYLDSFQLNFKMKIEITRKELFLEFKDSLKLKNDEFFDKLIDFINLKFKKKLI